MGRAVLLRLRLSCWLHVAGRGGENFPVQFYWPRFSLCRHKPRGKTASRVRSVQRHREREETTEITAQFFPLPIVIIHPGFISAQALIDVSSSCRTS